MSFTICAPVQVKQRSYPYSMDYSRNSNKAGSPLPSIPRRTSSSSPRTTGHAHSHSEPSIASITTGTITVPAAKLVIHPPTPPQPQRAAMPISVISLRQQQQEAAATFSDSDSSSSLSDDSQPTIIRRPKKMRRRRSPPIMPADAPTTVTTKPRSGSGASQLQSQTTARAMRRYSEGVEVIAPRPAKALSPGTVVNLRLDPASHGRHVSDSHVAAPSLSQSQSGPIPAASASASGLVASASSPGPLLRSKSGAPLKSSLKGAARPGLSVITRASAAASKSEPNTPTLKAVHFDAQLEHVKLFLAEQKPLAVSRDGSPTDDTSGTESEFPSFIYGTKKAPAAGAGEEARRVVLVMALTNMPTVKRAGAEVALEALTLAPDSASIYGRVRVKNLAFEKWLAVRFTFDWWQTTSEVTAKYVESLESSGFDIFGFTIRLNDIMARIEEKVLLLALRYTVAGREIWDNNGGENYLAKFTKTKVAVAVAVAQPQLPPRAIPSDSEEDVAGRAITHLKSKLEQVAQGRTRSEAQKPPPLHAQFAVRYDFSDSLKRGSWKGAPASPRHLRTSTYPVTSPNTIPFPQKVSPVPGQISFGLPSPRTSALGSPGSEDALLRSPLLRRDEAPSPILPRRESRNHQRGYFDRSVSDSSGVKRTPSGTPMNLGPPDAADSVAGSRFNSFPPSSETHKKSPAPAAFVPAWAVAVGGSEDSTPTMSSPSSSSRSSSATSSPTEEMHLSLTTKRAARELSPGSPQGGDHYSSFINRFCFYTGSGADSLLGVAADEIPRSHSASSVEEFLMHTPPAPAFASHFPSFEPPVRSPSFDELTCRGSGSTTPTAGSFIFDSRSPTPVMK